MKENQEKNVAMDQGFVGDIRSIIDEALATAVRSVNFSRVQMYWNIGRRIFEEEQQGKERADYGTYLIRHLAKELEPEYGSGFSVRQLEQSRQFYRTYPIANTLRLQLNWSQYRRLIQIEDADKREYYELESVNNSWTAKETERQIRRLISVENDIYKALTYIMALRPRILMQGRFIDRHYSHSIVAGGFEEMS